MPDDVLCVVPAFKPPTTLIPLASALSTDAPTLVIDDASPCTSDRLFDEVREIPGIYIKRHKRNRGIGRSLNDGLSRAREINASWLFTVDQDSALPADYLEQLTSTAHKLNAASLRFGGIGAGSIKVSGSDMTYPGRRQDLAGLHVLVTHEIVQSGSLWHVDSMIGVGGFNERLGMDAVDAEACLKLRERGLLIAALPQLSFDHQIGTAQAINKGWTRTIYVTKHSPKRRSSMLRNRFALFPREFQASPIHAIRTIRRVIVNQFLGKVTK